MTLRTRALVSLIAVAALAGCGNNETKLTTPTTANSSMTTTATTSPSTSSSSASTSSSSSTTTSASNAAIEKFCARYAESLYWSMSRQNSETIEKAYANIGQPVTADNRAAMQRVLEHTRSDATDLIALAPADLLDDLKSNAGYIEQMWQARINSQTGIVAPKPNDQQRAAGERILSYTDAHCPGLPGS